MKYLLCLSFSTFIFLSNILSNDLIINELLADNETSYVDTEGGFPDWIELYNGGELAINLVGYVISDGDNSYTFSEKILEVGTHLLVFASDKDAIIGNEIHLNFKLSSEGETLTLFNPAGMEIDNISFPEIEEDISYGRQEDGADDWQFFSVPTPATNNGEGLILPIFTAQIDIAEKSGFYTESFTVKLENTDAESQIYYTLDGSIPDPTDNLYIANQTIEINGNVSDSIAFINTSDEWIEPSGNLQTASTLRAVAYKNGQQNSKIINRTFFVDPLGAARYSLPIVSIFTENQGVFDSEIGIYVKGNNENYFRRGREQERLVAVEFLDEEGNSLLQQDAGLRLGGAKTRNEPQKTIRLYAREEYGDSKFRYPFWGEDYATKVKKITLRTMNLGPWSEFGFTDDLVHQITEGETLTDQVRRSFAIVFLNGVYWGIHSMREHNDEHFLARNYEIDDEDIVKAGKGEAIDNPNSPYFQLLADLEGLDLSQSIDYQDFASKLDVERYMDYIITNLAVANRDWPDNNTEFWSSTALDNKIRFLMNDLDAAMTVFNDERLSLYFATEVQFLEREPWNWALLFMQNLLKNEAYRSTFKARLTELLTTTFSPDRTTTILHEMRAELKPEISEHIRRWHYPLTEEKWEKATDRLVQFLLRRPDFLLQQSYERLGFPTEIFPNPVTETLQVDFKYAAQHSRTLSLTDASGRVIIPAIRLSPEIELHDLDLGKLASGIYFLKVESDGIINSFRVMKIGT